MEMTKESLKERLDEHALWLKTRASDNIEGTRADLSNADLTDADLMSANLTDADLTNANLTSAKMLYLQASPSVHDAIAAALDLRIALNKTRREWMARKCEKGRMAAMREEGRGKREEVRVGEVRVGEWGVGESGERPEADASGTEPGNEAKAKRKLGRVRHHTAPDFVFAWYEPGREDGADARKVQAWASRNNVPGVWVTTARIDCETVVAATLYRNSATYALRVCRALVAAIQVQANHARRYRRNRAMRNEGRGKREEVRVGEVRVGEVRVGEVRVGEVRVGEVRVGESGVGELGEAVANH